MPSGIKNVVQSLADEITGHLQNVPICTNQADLNKEFIKMAELTRNALEIVAEWEAKTTVQADKVLLNKL